MSKKNAPKRVISRKNLLSQNPNFAIVEAYKTARVNMMFALAAADSKITTFTSCNPVDGKSTTAMNMAIAFAQTGKRTLLIDGDMRKPTVHSYLKLNNTAGLSSALGQFTTLEESITYGAMDSLDVITAGPIPPNPAELLMSPRMEEMLKSLSENYDYILIDSPPVNVVGDALILGKLSGGISFVIREGHTNHNDIARALQAIEFAGVKVLGFIKVGCAPRESKYGGNYKKYKYGGKYGSRYGGYGYGYGYGRYGYSSQGTASGSKTDESSRKG